MQATALLALVWLLALLGWLVGASAEEKPSENPFPSIVDMWERPVINITAGFPFEGEHPLCSDPLMRLALRIGIKCNPPPPIVFN
jgi:hypothetical protein